MIIGIAGKKKAGKDTVLGCIQHWLPNRTIIRLAFADALKAEVAKGCGVSTVYLNNNKEHFRLILQGWGTDFRRKLMGDDYWINKWQSAANYILANSPDSLIIAPDVRFKNEANVILENGGFVIRVNRANVDLRDEHESENDLNAMKFPDTVTNDGDIVQLADKVKEVLVRHSLLK